MVVADLDLAVHQKYHIINFLLLPLDELIYSELDRLKMSEKAQFKDFDLIAVWIIGWVYGRWGQLIGLERVSS